MRIDANPATHVDVDGAPLVSPGDGGTVQFLAMSSNASARGAMATADLNVYRGFPHTGAGTSWESLGDFPESALVLLSTRELSICTPSEGGATQLKVWARYPLTLTPQPSTGFFWAWSPSAAPVSLPAAADAAHAHVSVQGGVVLLAPGGHELVLLDFAADTAAQLSRFGYQERAGVAPAALPADPFLGPLQPELALPAGPYRVLANSTSNEGSVLWWLVGCREHLVVLSRNLRTGGKLQPVQSIPTAGVTWTGGTAAEGRLVAVGANASGEPAFGATAVLSAGAADVEWFTWASGDSAVEARACTAEGRCWVTHGRALFRTEDVGESLLQRRLPMWNYLRGPAPAQDSRFQTLDRAQGILDVAASAFGGAVLTAQRGGTLATFYDPLFRFPLYRRFYRGEGLVTRLGSSSTDTPTSPPITLGQTLSPPAGFGPDDVE